MYVEELKASEVLCANASFVASCNAALQWGNATVHGCPAGAASCAVLDALAYNASAMPAGGVALATAATPLHVPAAGGAARLYNANACRYAESSNASAGLSVFGAPVSAACPPPPVDPCTLGPNPEPFELFWHSRQRVSGSLWSGKQARRTRRSRRRSGRR